MKTIAKFFVAAVLLFGTVSAYAQQEQLAAYPPLAAASKDRQQKDSQAWLEKLRSERIAFLTAEIGISPSEAEKFWPLYNEAEQKRAKALERTMEAFRDLDGAVRAGKSEKELSSLLQKYLDAVKESRKIDEDYVAKYRKVLSVEKIAKLYVAEEKFRRQSIHRLHGGPKPQ